jgi:hypothetical protein
MFYINNISTKFDLSSVKLKIVGSNGAQTQYEGAYPMADGLVSPPNSLIIKEKNYV